MPYKDKEKLKEFRQKYQSSEKYKKYKQEYYLKNNMETYLIFYFPPAYDPFFFKSSNFFPF